MINFDILDGHAKSGWKCYAIILEGFLIEKNIKEKDKLLLWGWEIILDIKNLEE